RCQVAGMFLAAWMILWDSDCAGAGPGPPAIASTTGANDQDFFVTNPGANVLDPKNTTGTIAFHVAAGAVVDPNPRGTWAPAIIPIDGVNVAALGRTGKKFTVNQGRVTTNSDSGLNSATATLSLLTGTGRTLSTAEAKWNASVSLKNGVVNGYG